MCGRWPAAPSTHLTQDLALTRTRSLRSRPTTEGSRRLTFVSRLLLRVSPEEIHPILLRADERWWWLQKDLSDAAIESRPRRSAKARATAGSLARALSRLGPNTIASTPGSPSGLKSTEQRGGSTSCARRRACFNSPSSHIRSWMRSLRRVSGSGESPPRSTKRLHS